jgi:ferritin-like metal-binding protein YciE
VSPFSLTSSLTAYEEVIITIESDGISFALIEEGSEILEAEGPEPVIDSALTAAAQRVEHYEISAYGTAVAFANHLEHAGVE